MNNSDITSQITKWIGITVIGLLLLSGIGIVPTMFTNYGFNSGHTLAFGFVPFHFCFSAVLFFILIIILVSRWLFWSNTVDIHRNTIMDIRTKIVPLKY